ncbi:MAG: AsmA-like C-terminal domain-containing protein [Caldimicrobium sp.]
MKKFLLSLFVLFILFLILIGIVSFNLEYFLNKDFFKRKIQDYVAKLLDIRIDYKRVNVNLYKLKVEVEGFDAKGKNFEISLPKGRVLFSQKKLLSRNFYPSEIYFKNPHIKVIYIKREEEKPFEIQKLYHYLFASSPISVLIKNGTLELFYGEKKGFIIKDLNLLAKDKSPQVLFDLNATSSFFAFLDFKGRLNYKDQFFEGNLNVKKLDLRKVNHPKLNLLKKTELDLSSTISLEKDTLNLGFTGSAPCLVFNKNETPFVCGFFQGYFIGNKDSFELKLSPVDMKYPEVKGEILVKKKKDNLFLEGGLKALSLDQIKEVISPHISENLRTKVFDIVKAGHLENLSFYAEGKNFKELFNPRKIKVSGWVKGGEINLSMLPLYISDIEGKLTFERGILDYQGRAFIEGKIFSEIKNLNLDFIKDKKTIGLSLNFEGDSRVLMDVGKRFVKDTKIFENIEVEGALGGSLKLSGEIKKPEIILTLRPENTFLKTHYLKDWLIIQDGEIEYQKEKVHFKDLLINYAKNSAQGISGEISLIDKNFSLMAKSFYIKEGLIEELLEKSKAIKETFERYQIKFNTLKLANLSYQGNLDRFKEPKILDLLSSLTFTGEASSVSLEWPLNGKGLTNETLKLESPLLKFAFKDKMITLLESQVLTENSLLTLSGEYSLDEGVLKVFGNGLLSKSLIEKFNPLKEGQIALKDIPIEIKSFNLIYSKEGGLKYKGENLLKDLSLETEIQKKEGLYVKGRIFSQKNDFGFDFSKEKDNIVFSYKGKSDFEEIAELFVEPLIERGLVEGNFRLGLKPSQNSFGKESFSLEKLPNLIRHFLSERPLTLEGILNIKDLKIKGDFNITGNFSMASYGLKGENLIFGINNSTIQGNIALNFKEKFLNIKGNLYIENLDLKEKLGKEKEVSVKEEKKPSYLKLIRELPLQGDIKVEIARVILPTSHELNKVIVNIAKDGEIFRIEAPDIQICNLQFYGEYENNSEFQYLFVDLKPAKGDFLDLFSCLYPEEMPKIIFEGPFEMQGFFYTDGEKALFENSFGKLDIVSHEGYIYRAPLIARVLGFLSPIDLFRGKIPNLENNLLPYEELNFHGEFKDTAIYLDTFFLSAPGFRMFGSGPISLKDKKVSLTFLVSPFKTVDVILEHIPFINKWVLGKERMLIYLPLEVVGTYDNPTIVPLHPASIGKGLFRFIFKFFGIQEDFFKKQEGFEKFKKPELFQNKSGDSLRR